MFRKLSLRWRLTLLTSLLIAVCCIGLSIVLNVSANRMANTIDAMGIQPAQSTEPAMNAPMMPYFAAEASETAIQAKHSYRIESLLYTVIAVLVGGCLTYCVAGKALEPVKILSKQVKHINAHNLNESLAVPVAGDELTELTESFNDMTDKLAQAFEMQKRFSADAAHELRTPLAVLQTKLDVFRKKKEHTSDEYEAVIAVFEKQIRRLRGLVTELLDIANMEHELQKQDVALKMLLEDVASGLLSVAEKDGITIALNSDDWHIPGDYDLLYRAFYNLIENAVKYNVSGGNVAIEAMMKEKEHVIINIKDTGIGIPDAVKEQIFTPFYRVDKSRSREMGGAGLGLALTDTIIKKHNGTITVSDNHGSGSCFTVTLPMEF